MIMLLGSIIGVIVIFLAVLCVMFVHSYSELMAINKTIKYLNRR